ncbi:MAG: hypothetical protein E4H29_04635 [Deltaproteobacteria bacterium]|nr:MAG: hypothetical protein E4H29_04635 [Deltaproteobacteria bacterium]
MGEADVKIAHTVAWREDGGEPDAALARGSGVAYRYTLCLRDPEEAGTILRILADVSIPLLYLLLVPRAPRGGYRAYIGLASPDVLDLPVRFASRGIMIERGEEMGDLRP